MGLVSLQLVRFGPHMGSALLEPTAPRILGDSNLKSYGASGVGVGPAPKFNGTVASVTGLALENLPGTA